MTKDYYLKHQELMKQAAQNNAEMSRKVRTAIRAMGREVSVDEISQALPNEDKGAIQKALYSLSRNPKSDLFYNGVKGRGSKYGVGIKLIDTVEE
jgi:predicted MarR family transcription regulator